MENKLHLKKWVLAATLLVLFAPIGFLFNKNPIIQHGNLSFSLSLNSASAQTTTSTTPTTGTTAAALSPKATQQPDLVSCLTNGDVATCGVYFISYVINDAISLFVTLGAFLIRFGLQLNDNIFNSPAVQTGFSVTLAIANLGFVLGIIIIALATILRSQTYGVKQLLWKLVVMAILVNFGLVITAPIVGLADSMSNYFVNATSPSAATGGYEGYVTTITNAFAPQAINSNLPSSAGGSTTGSSIGSALCSTLGTFSSGASVICSLASTVASKVVAAPDVFMQQVNAMFFGITFNSLTAFTFICIAVLLIVRYLMLAGLLIVLPIAWLTFIFPKYDSNFSKWWTTFIKWTLFPPIALFFIYLAMITASNIPGTANTSTPSYLATAAALPTGANNGPEGALVYQTGLGGPIQQAADEVLLVGLTIMGLMFASSLSGKAGTSVIDGAKSAGKFVGGYVGKKGKRLVGDRVRTAGRKYNPETKETTSWLQRMGSQLQGIPIPGLRGVGASIANNTAPKAVQEDRKEDVKHYIDENLKNLTNEGIKSRANSVTAFANPTIAAAIAQELARRDMTNQIDPKKMDKYLEYAEKMGTADAVYNNRPDLMKPRVKKAGVPATSTSAAIPPVMETKEEAVVRAIKASKGDVININAQVFNAMNPKDAESKLGAHVGLNPDMLRQAVLALNSTQLGTLGNDPGSAERKKYITETMKDVASKYRKEIEKKEDELDASGKKTGKVITIKTGKWELDQTALKAALATNKELENLEGLVKHMENSSNWASALGNN